MVTIGIIAALYIASFLYMGYEMKNAIDDPEDFNEREKKSSSPVNDEVDENCWFNTACAI